MLQTLPTVIFSPVIRPACFQGLCFHIPHFLEELPTEKPFFIFNYLGERLPAAKAQTETYQMNGSNFWGQYLQGFVHSKQGLSTPNYRCGQGCPGQLLMGWEPSCLGNEATAHGRIKKPALGIRPNFHFSKCKNSLFLVASLPSSIPAEFLGFFFVNSLIPVGSQNCRCDLCGCRAAGDAQS